MSESSAWQQGHTRALMGMPKGRPSAQAATFSERARSQSTSITMRLLSPTPTRYTRASLRGASNAPLHTHSRARSRPHAARPAGASQEDRTLLRQETTLGTPAHPQPRKALSQTDQTRRYHHERDMSRDTAPARRIPPRSRVRTIPVEANSAKTLLQQHKGAPRAKTAGHSTVLPP